MFNAQSGGPSTLRERAVSRNDFAFGGLGSTVSIVIRTCVFGSRASGFSGRRTSPSKIASIVLTILLSSILQVFCLTLSPLSRLLSARASSKPCDCQTWVVSSRSGREITAFRSQWHDLRMKEGLSVGCSWLVRQPGAAVLHVPFASFAVPSLLVAHVLAGVSAA